MPRPSFNKRKRSTEIASDFHALIRAKERRRKNSTLFAERRGGALPQDYHNWDEDIVSTAHNGNFVDIDYSIDADENDLLRYLHALQRPIKAKLRDAWYQSARGGISFNIGVLIKYYSLNDPEKVRWFTLTSDYYQIFTAFDINQSVEAACEDLMTENDYYQDGGSSWVVEDVLKATLMYQNIGASNAVSGGGGRFAKMIARGGSAHIQIPKWIENKKCVVNFQNKDDKCFMYAMECALIHRTQSKLPVHAERVSQYTPHFDYSDIEMPFHPMDLEVFEQLNKNMNMALHVYTATDQANDIAVLYSSPNNSDTAWHVNLLLMTEEKKSEQLDVHWLYITSLHRFLVNPSINARHVFCQRCTQDFPTEAALKKHVPVCCTNECAAPEMPEKYEKWKYFTNYHKMLEQDFVIYADFEAFNTVISHSQGESKTEENRMTEHVGASFGFHTVCRVNPAYNKTVLYTYPGDDITDKFLIGKEFIRQLELERDRINDIISREYSYPLDCDVEKDCHECCVCRLSLDKGYMPHWSYTTHKKKEDFKDPSQFFNRLRQMKQKPIPPFFRSTLLAENKKAIPVWDAHKAVDNYIGKAHFACARNRPGSVGYKTQKIPVMFHNLSNYDAHFIIKALDPEALTSDMQFGGIPQSGDKFMSFSFRGLKFVDTYRFMQESLDKLSQNLLKSGRQSFSNFNAYFAHYSEEKRGMLLQKGVFPYEYFNHPRVFKETVLPPIHEFFSRLRDEGVSQQDYDHGCRVWQETECKIFKDYHDLYLVVDVLLLADIFENFRTICLTQHRLDPVHYVSLPGYSWDSAFIFAGAKWDGDKHVPFSVELFDNSQNDMYLFCEDSIRGGVSMTPGRFSRANHKYLNDFDPKEVEKYIFYLDANNLYGHAMIQPLPYADYKWVPSDSIKIDEIKDIPKDCPYGYIFEVDGHFPDDTHDYLSDFPPAPTKQKVTEDMISPFSRKLNEDFGNKHDDKTTKLLCTLEPRKEYKCYYSTLQLYMKLGFVVTKVHRILRFKQSTWLAGYIQHNTSQRAKCTSDFEKDFYKLLNNSVYGKFIQNNRKFKSIKALLPDTEKKKWNPFIQGRRIINERFVLAYMKPKKVALTSAMIIGTVILDHSKHLMYNFYYNVMKEIYLNDIRLLFTDTDSLCMEIKHPDVMADLKDRRVLDEWFDLSDFPKDTSMYGANYQSNTNKKVIGKFKDEFPLVYLKEVIALRSKMYSCLKSDGKNKQTAKGVQKAVKKTLIHEKYMRCLHPQEGQRLETATNISFRSQNDVIYTIGMEKVTLSPCDSKLYLVDATHTKPFGHYSLPRIQSS